MKTFTFLVMASPDKKKVSKSTLALGISLTIAGFALRAWSTGYAGIATRTTKDDNPPEKLITGGPFRYSRNPIYLGNQFMFAGVLITLGHGIKSILFSIPAFLFYSMIVRYEESLLSQRFRQTYSEYKSNTPRWIPDRMPDAKGGAEGTFSLKKAIETERFTLYNCARLFMMRQSSTAVRRRIRR